MATAPLLPVSLQHKLSSLSLRIRLLRAVRGASVLAILLVTITAAAFLADFWFDLVPLARAGLIAAGGALALGTLLFSLVVPLCRRIDSDALAAAVEEHYPQLGERLTTTVELCTGDQGYGTSPFAALLLEETEEHSGRLEFLRAVSPRAVQRLAIIAVAFVLAFLLSALLLPQWYQDRVERFLFVSRAAGATEDPQGQPVAVPSVPVALTSESTAQIIPPAYAAPHRAPQVGGLVDFRKALQHSELHLKLAFDRPAGNATVLWSEPLTVTPAGSSQPKTQSAAASLADDQLSATLSLPLKRDGTYRYHVVLENPAGVRTDSPEHKIEVILDRPPEFLKVTGDNELPAVLGYQRIPLQISVKDDIQVARAEVQLRINGQSVEAQPLPLDTWGSRTADGEHVAAGTHVLQLSKLRRPDRRELQPGDVVSYRLMAADNREVADLKPQVVYYPPNDQWRTLRISRLADPLDYSRIAKEQLELRHVLETARAELIREQRTLNRLQQDSQEAAKLTETQKRDLEQLRKDEQRSRDDLAKAAREALQDQAATPVAKAMQDLADRELTQAAQALSEIARQDPQKAREPFKAADNKFRDAIVRIDQLLKENDRLAVERTEQMKVETAAERQQQLADRAAEMLSRDPVREPTFKPDREQLKHEQSELTAELERLADRSERLRSALDLLHAEQLKQDAAKAHELAQQQRELARDIRKAEKDRLEEKLNELARKQQELAEKAERLAEETRPAADATKAAPLQAEQVRRPTDPLKQGDLGEAQTRQEQAARELERHAADLQKAVDLAKDPKEAARQLAKLEESLRRKLSQMPPAATADAIQREQQAIERAARDLSVPPQDAQAHKDQEQAVQHADKAAEAIRKNDSAQASKELEQTQKALNQLADRLPSLQQRQKQALAEIGKLKQTQDEVARQSEKAVRNSKGKEQNDPRKQAEVAKQLKDAARKQADITERLGKMDAPNQEARQQRTQDSVNKALQDLMDARRQDIPASQAEAKRQIDRLEQALKGKNPPDEQARDLARQQRDLAAEAARAAENPHTEPGKQQDMAKRQEQIAKDAKNLPTPEAPQRHAEAAHATQQAEQEAKNNPASAKAQEKMQVAARALERLAHQLDGKESDSQRAERLAQRQSEAAAESEKHAGEKSNPPPSAEQKARQQEIADEAKQIRGGDEAGHEKQHVQEALDKAATAPNPQQRAQAQREAERALHDLAGKLAKHEDSAKPLPQQQAKDLAKQQLDLARATHQAAEEAAKQSGEPAKKALHQALEQVGKQQAELNKQAAQLPAAENAKALEQAHEAMEQAREALKKGDPTLAERMQQQAARNLSDLAPKLPAQATVAKRTQPGPFTEQPQGLPRKEQADQAEQLAKEQRALKDAVQKTMDELARETSQDPRSQELAKQQQALEQHAGELQQELGAQAAHLDRNPHAQQHASEAAKAVAQARAKMQQGRDQDQKDNTAQAEHERTEAAGALDRAAQEAAEAAAQQPAQQTAHQPADPQTGKNLEQALGQMSEAEKQLQQGAQHAAQEKMAQAAQSLQQLAKQLPQQPQQGQPNREKPKSPTPPNLAEKPSEFGMPPGGVPDLSHVDPEMKKYAGKRWGELPGELQTKIMKELTAQYGRDYAVMIKRYYETLADTNRK